MKTQRFSASVFWLLLLFWNSCLLTKAAEAYVDLSSFFDQDAFVTQGNGAGSPLDNADHWLDADTLPGDYRDGTPYSTVDGLIHFQHGRLKGDDLDAVRVKGQTIPMPAGQYRQIHFGWLATDGDMVDLSRFMKLNYTDGTSEQLQIGPIAGWFNSPAAFADSIHTFFDESAVTYSMNIIPNVDDEEPDGTFSAFVLEIFGSALQERPNSRFMDGTSVLTYEIDLPDDLSDAALGIQMQNNFVVSLSDDFGFSFFEVLNSQDIFGEDVHDGSNRDIYTVDFGLGRLRFDNQIEIEGDGDGPFSDGGDSGSLIVGEELRAVALLFAGSDQGGANGQGLTYANPIHAVFDALKVELAL